VYHKPHKKANFALGDNIDLWIATFISASSQTTGAAHAHCHGLQKLARETLFPIIPVGFLSQAQMLISVAVDVTLCYNVLQILSKGDL
jgi:hypothetical protein